MFTRARRRRNLRLRAGLSAVALLLLAACQQGSEAGVEMTGRVSWIADGDTLQLSVNDRHMLIRLHGIDAPERDQPWGRESRRALSRLTLHQQVTARVVDIDQYDRLVAVVFVGDTNVNRAQVASGNAWVYDRYADDPVLYELERRARQAETGLWQLPGEPRPPWEFRHR